jgi:glycosyltransferase involved in cell wall biosynthesis
MQIIVLENEPSSRRGGQELSLVDVSQELVRRGHQLMLLYTRPGDLLSKYQNFCSKTIPVSQYRFTRQTLSSGLPKMLADLGRIPAHRHSLIYCNQYQDSFFAMLLSRVKGGRVVCHLRLPPPPQAGLQAGLGLRHARRLIAVSAYTRQEWSQAQLTKAPIDIVHNGINPAAFGPAANKFLMRQQLNLPQTGLLVSYVGRLDRVKGIDTLIRSFAQFRAHHTTAHLVIAGKPLVSQADYANELAHLVYQKKLSSAVTFLGHVDCPQQIYQASDINVVPSQWPEPFGRTLIEAMACGTPVIGSRAGGIPEVLSGEFAQGLFPAGNVEALSTCLQAMVYKLHTTPDLGQRCRQHVLDNFTIQRNVDGIEACFHQVLKR